MNIRLKTTYFLVFHLWYALNFCRFCYLWINSLNKIIAPKYLFFLLPTISFIDEALVSSRGAYVAAVAVTAAAVSGGRPPGHGRHSRTPGGGDQPGRGRVRRRGGPLLPQLPRCRPGGLHPACDPVARRQGRAPRRGGGNPEAYSRRGAPSSIANTCRTSKNCVYIVLT